MEEKRKTKSNIKIAFCITCKNRTPHLKQTLPRNLLDNPKSLFIILNYGTEDDLVEWLTSEHGGDLDSGRLVLYNHYDTLKFRMAHAKNMAARCGIREGADILVTLDADNFAGFGFESYLEHKFAVVPGLSYLCPDVGALPPVGHRFNKDNPEWLGRGFMGRLAIRVQDFIKAGGYNERFETWQGEDIDLLARLRRLRLRESFIDSAYLNAIAHSSEVRFREWPEAQRYENNDIYGYVRNSKDTIANYGDVGCGEVFRNFDETPMHLRPISTRIFGIGMQRTGTYSLYRALEILGFDSAHWESANWAASIWYEMNRWGRSSAVERSYAICDNPTPLVYRGLDIAYPGSKFILTVRDENQWLRSVEKFWTYEGNPQRWTWDIDGFSHKVHGMIYGRATFDRDIFLERYRQHNLKVVNYFKDRPDDLLILDIDDEKSGATWERLCDFLNVSRPAIPYPNETYGRDSVQNSDGHRSAPGGTAAPAAEEPSAASSPEKS